MTAKRKIFNRIFFLPLVLCAFVAVLIFSPLLSGEAYAADSVKVELPVSVTYPADAPTETFKIKTESLGSDPVQGDEYISIEGSGSANIGPFTYDKPGSYKFLISQEKGSISGVSYDDTKYELEIFVYNTSSSDLSSGLSHIVLLRDYENPEVKPAGINFKNSYKDSEPEPETVSAKIPPIHKTVNNLVKQDTRSTKFSFTFTRNDSSYPMPEGANGDTLTVDMENVTTEGYAEVGNLTFTQTGDYSYTVKEIDSKVKGYTYDKSEYVITYYVRSDAEGKLSATCSVLKDGSGADVDYFNFLNEFDSTKATGDNEDGETTTGFDDGKKLTDPKPSTDVNTGSKRISNVNTGDKNDLLIPIAVSVAAAAGIVVIIVFAKRSKRKGR